MDKVKLENTRITAFESLYGVSNQKEILKLFREDCVKHKEIKNDDEAKELSASALFSKYVLGITFLYSLSSIKENLKVYKKVIKELRLGSLVQDKFYFKGLFGTVSKITKAKTEEKKEEGKGLPFDVKEEIKRVKKILDDESYDKSKNQTFEQVRSYYLTYILGLSTGRRFTEIMKTISIKSRKEGYFFEGLLKKKDSLKNRQLEAKLIELTAREVNQYLKELREYLNRKLLKEKKRGLEELEEKEVNTIFSRVYNNAIMRISNKKVPNFHELRHIYTLEHQERYIAQNSHLANLNNDDLEVVLRNVRYTVLGHEIKEDTTYGYVVIK